MYILVTFQKNLSHSWHQYSGNSHPVSSGAAGLAGLNENETYEVSYEKLVEIITQAKNSPDRV
jgi:hypothetical protein